MNINAVLDTLARLIADNPLVKLLVKFIAEDPLAYPYLGCIAAGLVGLIAVMFYSARCKRLLKLLQGPIPKLSESDAVRKFDYERTRLRGKADSAGFWAGAMTIICFLLGIWLYRTEDHLTVGLITGIVLESLTVIEYFSGGGSYGSQIYNIEANRPELASLKYLQHLPETPRNSDNGKLYWATLDDFVCVLQVDTKQAQTRVSRPQEATEAQAISEAQWRAYHEEKPTENELVLLLWRDGTTKRIKTVVTRVKSVYDIQTETLMTKQGKAIMKAATYKFSGGKIAHYSDAPNDKIERGWLATADRAHVLLASLRWLDDDQREFCYQLINPGKALPPVSEWTAGQ